MYGDAGRYYDKLYGSKDYAAEADRLVELIRRRNAAARSLLDVACGTGAHLESLARSFDAEGLDLSRQLLEVARQRLPGVRLHRGDMAGFDLGRSFDAVVCMFNSIGYAKTRKRLGKAIACMARHLGPGGILIVEPWFSPETWQPKPVYATFVDEPELKIARISTNRTEGSVSIIEMEYLIGTKDGTRHFAEHHEMGLFSPAEMREAFESAGLACEYLEEGVSGKGLYIGMPR